MEFTQNFAQTFTCVVCIRINFLPKMEFVQNFVQTFTCVVLEKTFYQKWSSY